MTPSMDAWLKEAKSQESAAQVGMYLFHNGVVRESARALVREGDKTARPVTGMLFSYEEDRVAAVVADTYLLPGVYYVKTWLNEGRLQVGDDLMYVLVGGDIRPHVVQALEYLVGRLKKECVKETEIY